MVGRRWETNADNYAVIHGYGNDLVSAFRKLEKDYDKIMREIGPVARALNKIFEAIDEHPPIKKRIEKILSNKDLYEAAAKNQANKVKALVLAGFGMEKYASQFNNLVKMASKMKIRKDNIPNG